jgi:hypothetical protein
VNFSDFVIEKEGNGNAFLKLEPTEGQSYQEFQDYVQAYPDANNGQRAYGVYKHADETETVLVAFGTMPGSTHYYEDLKAHYTDFGEADIHDAIDADLSLTGDQKLSYMIFMEKEMRVRQMEQSWLTMFLSQ